VTVYVVVAPGTNATPLEIPPDQLYTMAPVADKVTDLPAHTVEEGETEIPISGTDNTLIVTALLPVHPLTVPVTV